jgi:hypothetical protein
MKAKKISMVISISLFLIGVLLSIILTITSGNIFIDKWEMLLISSSIGISTGGLVAVLIEVPLAYANINSAKNFLESNGFYTYVYCQQLLLVIDDYIQNENKSISREFFTYQIEKINQSTIPFMHLDPHIYFCACRRKQIERFKRNINDFLMNKEYIELPMRIRILELKICATESGKNHLISSKDVKHELYEIKNKIIPLCDFINDTMELCLRQKKYDEWSMNVQTYLNNINYK